MNGAPQASHSASLRRRSTVGNRPRRRSRVPQHRRAISVYVAQFPNQHFGLQGHSGGLWGHCFDQCLQCLMGRLCAGTSHNSGNPGGMSCRRRFANKRSRWPCCCPWDVHPSQARCATERPTRGRPMAGRCAVRLPSGVIQTLRQYLHRASRYPCWPPAC